MARFKVTNVKKSQAEGFAPVSVKLEAGPAQRSQFEGKPWGSDDRPTGNEPLTVASAQERNVQELSFASPKGDESRNDDREFEWGRPLLGGSSDEEDFKEEDGSSFNRVSITLQGSERRIVKPDQEFIEEYTDDTGRRVKRIAKVTSTKTITRVERQAPSCMLAINVPGEDNENTEEYIDEHGRQVKRVIRSTVSESTKTVVRDGAVKFILSPGKSSEEDFEEHSEDTERIQTFTTAHGYRGQKISKSSFKTQLKGGSESVTSISPQGISAAQISQLSTGDTFDDGVFPVKVDRDISYPEWMELGKEDRPPSKEVSTSSIQIERYPTQFQRESAPEKPGVIEEVVPFTVEKRPLVIPLGAFEVEEDSLAVRGRKRIEPPAGGLPELPVIPRKKVHKEIPSSLLSESDMPESEPQGKVFELASPVYQQTGDEEVVPSVLTQQVVHPEWMIERRPSPTREIPNVEGYCAVLAYEPMPHETKGDMQREPGSVSETVVAANLNREVVFPEITEIQEEKKTVTIKGGVVVRQFTERPISTKSVEDEERQAETSEITYPVIQAPTEEAAERLDEDGVQVGGSVNQTTRSHNVVPSVQTRSVVLPEWMVEIEPTGKDKESWLILSTESMHPQPEEKFERQSKCLEQTVTSSTLDREVSIPEIEGTDNALLEECVDKNGDRIKTIIKRSIETSFVRSASDGDTEKPEAKISESAAPVNLKKQNEDVIPMTQTREIVLPEWMVESEPNPKLEYKHHTASPSLLTTGPKRTDPLAFASDTIKESVTATTLNREIIIPEIEDKKNEDPEKVTEYVDESGARFSNVFYSDEKVPPRKTRDVDLPKWMVGIPPSTEGEEKPHDGISCLIRPSELSQQEPEQVGSETVLEGVSTAALNRGFVNPEIEDTGDESAVEVAEFVDENGVRVRRIVRQTMTTRSTVQRRIFYQGEPDTEFDSGFENVVPSVRNRDIVLPEWMVVRDATPTKETPSDNISLILRSESKQSLNQQQDTEKVHESVTASTLNREIVIPDLQSVGPLEEVEEYDDKSGVQVKGIVKRVITTTSMKRESAHSQPVEVRFPAALSQFVLPEEKEENLVESSTVERIVITRSVLHSSVDEEGEEIQTKFFESAAPVCVEGNSEDIVPSRQFRDIVLPKWMVNSEPTQAEQMQPDEGITWVVLVPELQQPEPREHDAEVVSESVVATTLSREVVIPEVEDSETATSRAEVVYLENVSPQAVILGDGRPSSPRRGSIPFEASSIQGYIVLIETLNQYVMEHRSMIFICSSQHMQFNFVLENFLHWILVTLKTLCWMVPVSWQLSEVQEQLQQIKVLKSRGIYEHVHDSCQSC